MVTDASPVRRRSSPEKLCAWAIGETSVTFRILSFDFYEVLF
ncbi:hypothetical protein D3OALGB2SA_5216 [Olavius algarvensis associated proteobacterium Delta 3]|nr:hypothetical protein D3OALGB2SA_5216 [Olavius algarvensis associated proteobacterium Delta 3]